jgi:monoamine oxidase
MTVHAEADNPAPVDRNAMPAGWNEYCCGVINHKIAGAFLMLETAVVGAGLCGLALAATLKTRRGGFALFDARQRLGGRVLSQPCATAGMALDLGPTWYWPETQPRMSGLIADLGLTAFPQHDNGAVLGLADPNGTPARLAVEAVHGGAWRLEGGMGALIQALARRLPPENIHLDHCLTGVSDRGDHVELHFRHGDRGVTVPARRAVLAVPPRLLEERVAFAPALDEALLTAMRETHTWMAEQAKVAVGYRRPFWRAAELSGTAFIQHGQAVLGETADACDGAASRAALMGFLAFPAARRQAFHAGLPLLMASQLARLFGPEAQEGEIHYQDWATEPYTCSHLDLSPPAYHPAYGDPLLRESWWDGRLYFGATETARYGGGYLEGALEAAGRIRHDLYAQEEKAMLEAAR